jgi:hypothetical protein
VSGLFTFTLKKFYRRAQTFMKGNGNSEFPNSMDRIPGGARLDLLLITTPAPFLKARGSTAEASKDPSLCRKHPLQN